MGKDFTSASKDDNVYTPYSMTKQLLENEKFDYNKTVLEPCCGMLHIKKILEKYFKTEIRYYDKMYNWESTKYDFLTDKNKYNYIITNPPYSKLDKFIIKAKEIATEKFAFLCKITHLDGIERLNSEIFLDPNYPLTKVYLFVRQANLRFTNDEQEKKGYPKYREIRDDGKYPAGMYYYIWMIFENIEIMDKHSDDYDRFCMGNYPILKWIDNNKYILRKKDV